MGKWDRARGRGRLNDGRTTDGSWRTPIRNDDHPEGGSEGAMDQGLNNDGVSG